MHKLLYIALLSSILCSCNKKKENDYDSIEHYYLHGSIYESKDKAIRFVQEYPDDENGWTVLGHIYLGIYDTEKAENSYNKALSINNKKVEALTGKSMILRNKGKMLSADSLLEKVIHLDPDYTQPYLNISEENLKRRNLSKALLAAEEAFKKDNSNPVAAANLCVINHYADHPVSRDKYYAIADSLYYKNMDKLKAIINKERVVLFY